MLHRRVPWWIYLIAAIYILTFAFSARQEVWGPANAGWVLSWPAAQVAGVSRGGPIEKAGVRAGDVLAAANRQPITRMPDWFVARAHFELHRPIDLRIQHGGQSRSLKAVITEPTWRAWSTLQFAHSEGGRDRRSREFFRMTARLIHVDLGLAAGRPIILQ